MCVVYLGYLSRPKHDFVKKIRKITGFDSDKTKNILSLLVEDGSSLENIKDEPRILWRKPILETKDHYHVNVYSLLSPFLFYQSMANEIFEEESYKHEFFRDVGRFFESEFDNVMKGKVDVLIPKSEIHKPGVSKFRDLEELFNKIYEIRKKVGIDAPITKTDLADRFILDGNTLWACEIKAHFPSNLSKDENLIKRIVEYRAYCEEMLIKSEFILQHPDFVAGEIIGENIDILKCEVKPLIISRYYEPARMPEYKAKASLVEAGVESWQRPWNLVECLERWLEIEAKHASIRKINSTPIISFADVVSGDYKKELLKY
ncbi:MAG: hypothetical protein QMD14_03430 [Candidatus Aenigmarchaeota archaeon]|nr:hypothetical protein [Candidatus Aenigmarchaeota archaeon]